MVHQSPVVNLARKRPDRSCSTNSRRSPPFPPSPLGNSPPAVCATALAWPGVRDVPAARPGIDGPGSAHRATVQAIGPEFPTVLRTLEAVGAAAAKIDEAKLPRSN